MNSDTSRSRVPAIKDVRLSPAEDGYVPTTIQTDRGTVECRYYPAARARAAAVWVGGVGGDWDSPARHLYPLMCRQLTAHDIASLRVKYRFPTELDEAVHDVLAGAAYLAAEGIDAIGLTGHSFGGAVVIQAGAASPTARTVVTLATQSYGARAVSQLAPHTSLLAIHGTADKVLSPENSAYVLRIAHEPKQLLLLEGAGHSLDEASQELRHIISSWLVEKLAAP